MARIGIYVPVWNSEKYVSDMINSVLSQTFEDWHMTFLDDESTDNTIKIIESFNDKRISLSKREKHCGLIGKLKNECISLLPETEYLCHVGSEDLIPKNCLENFVNLLKSTPDNIGAACGTFIAFDNDKQWMFSHVKNDKGFSSERLLRYMCMYPMRFYKRKTVESVGGYSNTLSSAVDYDMALRIDEKYTIIRYEKEISYLYRQHDQQVSFREKDKQNINAKEALQNSLDRRGLNKKVINSRPPFILEDIINVEEVRGHFIWSPK